MNKLKLLVKFIVSIILALLGAFLTVKLMLYIYFRIACSWIFCTGSMCELGPACPFIPLVLIVAVGGLVSILVYFVLLRKLSDKIWK